MSVTNRFAQQLAERDGGWYCHYCRIPLIPLGQLHIYGIPSGDGESYFIPDDIRTCAADHIVAKSKGGGDQLDNLVLACDYCNSKKGAMGYDAFVQKIRR